MRTLGIIGTNLRNLERTGQLSRFLDSYCSAYLGKFDRILIFSERPEKGEIRNSRIEVVPSRFALHQVFGDLVFPFAHKEVRECVLLRVMHMTGSVPAVLAKILLGVPFAATYGYDYADFVWFSRRSWPVKVLNYLYTWSRVRAGILFADLVIATTPHAARRGGKWELLPNGVRTSRFLPASATGSRPRPLRCIFVGRLELQKNLPALMKAMVILRERAIELCIVGDGSLRTEIERDARQTGVRVKFRGVVDHHELPRLLQESHLFILPSRREGLPKALLEAMSSGLACIGTETDGVSSVIRDRETGLLCNGSGEELADAILLLEGDDELRKRLGANARKLVCREYDLDRLLEREAEILSDLVPERP